MFFNKRRKSSTYLKYKNGHIIDTEYGLPEKESEEEMEFFNKFNKKNQSNGDKVTGNNGMNNNEPLNNKHKIVLSIGIILIMIPMIVVFLYSIKKNNGIVVQPNKTQQPSITVNQKQAKDDSKSSKSDNSTKNIISSIINKRTGDIKNLPGSSESVADNINNSSKLISDDVKLLKNKDLVLISNTVNKDMTFLYGSLKSTIVSLDNDKSSIQEADNEINTLKEIACKRYNNLLNKKALFTKLGTEDVYIAVENRYANFANSIDDLKNDMTTEDKTDTFNKTLDKDNSLCTEQFDTVKSYLDKNNVDYTTSNSSITLK